MNPTEDVAVPDARAVRERPPLASLPLDAVLEEMRSGAVRPAFDRLVAALAAARRAATPEAWAWAIAGARAHPLRGFLHRDPFTLRCFAHARQGIVPAAALDYALRPRALGTGAGDPVAVLHRCTAGGQAAQALRFRRDYLASTLDDAAAASARPLRVFAAGSGRLREFDRTRRAVPARIARIVAFDPEEDSHRAARLDYPRLAIAPHVASVAQLVETSHLFADMDLVYCAGLMETLPRGAARGLARALFGMVRRGGVLVITHFLPGLEEAGYLEAFMDWRMGYRSRSELFDLVREIAQDSVSGWVYSENREATLGAISAQRR